MKALMLFPSELIVGSAESKYSSHSGTYFVLLVGKLPSSPFSLHAVQTAKPPPINFSVKKNMEICMFLCSLLFHVFFLKAHCWRTKHERKRAALTEDRCNSAERSKRSELLPTSELSLIYSWTTITRMYDSALNPLNQMFYINISVSTIIPSFCYYFQRIHPLLGNSVNTQSGKRV